MDDNFGIVIWFRSISSQRQTKSVKIALHEMCNLDKEIGMQDDMFCDYVT